MSRTKILTAEDLNKEIPESLHAEKIQLNIQETNQLVERAFTELKENDIVEGKHTEKSIVYSTETGENVVVSRFAFFGETAYLSWIWVTEPIRGNGYGKQIVDQTLQELKRNGVTEVYTIPKSEEAHSIFTSFGFESSSELGSSWKVKQI